MLELTLSVLLGYLVGEHYGAEQVSERRIRVRCTPQKRSGRDSVQRPVEVALDPRVSTVPSTKGSLRG